MNPQSGTQVLMIDDEENDWLLVRHMVGKMPDPGCQFHWAGSYEQGLKVLGEIDWSLYMRPGSVPTSTGSKCWGKSTGTSAWWTTSWAHTPASRSSWNRAPAVSLAHSCCSPESAAAPSDRKRTRLNSSH